MEGKMGKFIAVVVLAAGIAGSVRAQASNPASVSNAGWTVTANSEQGALSIAYAKLGTVLANIRLNLKNANGLHPLTGWSAEVEGRNRLFIRTPQPQTAWRFVLRPNELEISSTLTTAVLTGGAPVPKQRIVARLLDPQGVSVNWTGTDEVENGYGGSITWHRSYLPERNPDVMYLALGQIASANLHSLFDRKTDTAISFSSETHMRRHRQNQNLLDLVMPVTGNALIRVIPNYYTKTLGVPFYVPFDDSYFRTAPMAWNSWDACYAEVDEKDIVQNTDWVASHLRPFGFQYIVLDDGYDRGEHGEHYWISNWNRQKFPHGPKWLTSYIKSKGLMSGVWLVPNSYAGAVKTHPNWYLRYKDGKIVLDYNTPALDSTNPAVLNFLRKEFTILDNWGFEYYKFDGEHAIPKYVPGIDLARLYDKSIEPLLAYRNRLKLIRATIGPRRFIEGCPAGTALNGIGYFDSYFNGADMYGSWQGQYALFNSINANAFLNHIVVYVMPGEGIDVHPLMSVDEAEKRRVPSVVAVARTRENPLRGFGVTLPQARTLVTYLALTGVVYSVASVMAELPEERARLLEMTLPTMPILPVDLFSRGTNPHLWDLFKHTTPDDYIHNFPEILDLKVHAKSGVYDVVGLTNWRSWSTARELSFPGKLGLSPGADYVAFDFWNQKLYGVFKDRMKVDIGPFDTRVFLIHPLENRPQLVGTSRHITGAYSILSLAWDRAKYTLRGLSKTVPGNAYTLWFYVRKGFSVSHAEAWVSGDRKIPVTYQLSGNSLKVSFQGEREPVSWNLAFRHAN
jgi:Melibiase